MSLYGLCKKYIVKQKLGLWLKLNTPGKLKRSRRRLDLPKNLFVSKGNGILLGWLTKKTLDNSRPLFTANNLRTILNPRLLRTSFLILRPRKHWRISLTIYSKQAVFLKPSVLKQSNKFVFSHVMWFTLPPLTYITSLPVRFWNFK